MSQIPPNPYGAAVPSHQPPIDPDASLKTQFKVLGVIFIVLSVLGFMTGGFGFVSSLIQIAMGKAVPPPNAVTEASRVGFYVGFYGAIFIFGVSALIQPIILWAGVNMLGMKGRSVIWVGAIGATIPLFTSCCILGTPFGIWAIIALMQPGAKKIIS